MSVKVIEKAIEPALLRSALASWPEPNWLGWHRYTGKTADKFGSLTYADIPRACRAALDALALRVAGEIGDSFIDYDLHASGLHMLPPGGFLAGHFDAECHPLRPWKRTHSVVLFVNDKWESDWGGSLLVESVGTFRPQFNKCVIFETEKAWHEVDSVATEADYRKTLALFAWKQAECSGRTSAQFEAKMTGSSG